ncbi:MAG: RNA-binding S4 domain-containing protein [Actinomycetales bacterium]|nr:RNA-binding S4 domain-containing protein [Actinomycetales bacterium]
MDPDDVRVDAWISAVRLVKSRSQASSACRAGHVSVNGQKSRPSSPVRLGDRITVRTPAGERVVVVRRLIAKRVGGPVAVTCYEDHTPPPPAKEEVVRVATRDRGSGRPTKRERRQLDRFRRGAG